MFIKSLLRFNFSGSSYVLLIHIESISIRSHSDDTSKHTSSFRISPTVSAHSSVLIRMGKHRGTGIHQDLIPGKFRHFLGHVRITKDRFGTLHIFMGNP